MSSLQVTIHIDALEGAIQPGSHLRVRLLDATAVGEPPIELGRVVIENWHGDKRSIELDAPLLADNRDYIVLAHAGPIGEISLDDWVTTDNVRVVDRTARICLHRV